MSELIDELLEASGQSKILGDVTLRGAYGTKKIELDVTNELSPIINKAVGHYVTLKFNKSFLWSKKIQNYISNMLTTTLNNYYKVRPKNVLVVGFGNENMVCDSLGKLVCKDIVVIKKEMANELNCPIISVFLPSVEGVTGLNSFELTKLVVKNKKPDLVIAIDSLTAKDFSRLGFTIQLSDAGISPGKGVENPKGNLNKNTLGVPVLSLGVPLLISTEDLGCSSECFYSHFTPKEIDFVIDKCSKVISKALNKSLYSKEILMNFG